MSRTNRRLSVIATANLDKLRTLRDDIARDAAAKTHKRKVLDRAEQMELRYAWDDATRDVLPLRR